MSIVVSPSIIVTDDPNSKPNAGKHSLRETCRARKHSPREMFGRSAINKIKEGTRQPDRKRRNQKENPTPKTEVGKKLK